MRAGKFDLAAEAYEKLAEAQPKSPMVWGNLGAARAMSGDCAGALIATGRAKSLNPNLFSPWYFSGFCHLQLHRNREALEDLTRAVKISPRDANAWYLKAQAAANLDHIAEAFSAALEALSLDPKRPEVHYVAGQTSLDLAAALYDRVLAGTPPNPFANRLEGDRNAAQGVVELARQSYQKAAELAPRDPDVHFGLATVYFQSRKLHEAEAEFRRTLELIPRATWAELRLARVLAEEGKTADAERLVRAVPLERLQSIDDLNEYLACALGLRLQPLARRALARGQARFPKQPELGTWSARLAAPSVDGAAGEELAPELLAMTGVGLPLRFFLDSAPEEGNYVVAAFPSARQYNQFRAAFLRLDLVAVGRLISPAVAHFPEEPGRAFVVAQTLHWLSYRFYERLGSEFPESEAAQRLAAENFSALGEQDKAIEIYQSLLAERGNSPDLLRSLARLYWTQHRWDEALKVLMSLVAVDSNDSTSFVNLGRIYSYQQDVAGAQRSFERATEIDPGMPEAHLGLGEIMRRRGDDQGALREIRLASDFEPDNPGPHYALAQIYRRLDRKDLAEQELKAFQRLQSSAAAGKAGKARQLVPLE